MAVAISFVAAVMGVFSTGVDSRVRGGADGGEALEANGIDEPGLMVDTAGEAVVLLLFLEPRLPIHAALSGRCQECGQRLERGNPELSNVTM